MAHLTSPVVAVAHSWAVRMADSVLARYPLAQARWHYEHGLVVKALVEVGEATEEPRYARFAQAWLDKFVTADGDIHTYQLEEFNLDQINPGKLLFRLYRQQGDERYARALRLLAEQLHRQPRTPSGGFWHKHIYPNQMWLDGLYMAGPFRAEYALTFGEPDLWEDVARQFLLIEQRTRDPHTGLLYHAWDESKTQPWANPETGCSPHFWGRAMGWYLMAIVDVLDFFPVEHPQRRHLIESFNRLAEALVRYQDPLTGLWYQVVDLPERPGNYHESSVSAMLAYAFAKATRRGYVTRDYASVARRVYRGLLENMIRVDAHGTLTLEGTCSVAGLGGLPYRDGSFEYYISEPVVANDFKGDGPFILAALEMDRAEVDKAP
jgi:unsaturated rhamnogalacturonyl hydrolase